MDELKIIKYLDGEMTGEELRQFNEELALNPLLAEEVRKFREIQEKAFELIPGAEEELDPSVRKEIREAVEEFKKDPSTYGDVPDDYREQLMDAERNLHRGRVPPTRMIRRIWYSTAALVVLAMIIATLVLRPFQTISNADLYSQYFSPYTKSDDLIELARNDNDFLFATSVYEAGDFDRSAALFEMLADSSSLRSWSLFYAGCSYMSLNQSDKAISLFEQALDADDEAVYPAARWNLALCYLKNGHKARAEDYLGQLMHEPEYRREVKRILRLLK